jgi:hypothetical protein
LKLRKWDDYADSQSFRGLRLAIVGNAGYLNSLEQGEWIDSHDLVLRMNNFRTTGFERQVGRRTDIWITTFHNDVQLERPELQSVSAIFTSVPFNFTKSPENGMKHRHAVSIYRGLRALKRDTVFTPNMELFQRLRRELGKYPTTGAMAIALATEYLVRRGAKVYVTGFSFFQGQSHYFSRRQVEARNHAPDRERALVNRLMGAYAAAGRIGTDPVMRQALATSLQRVA